HLNHAASEQYHKVRVGDVLWVVTSEEPNDLLLVGRLRVDKIVGQHEANRLMETPNLWESEFHVFTEEPQEKAYLNISRWATQLEFDGVVTSLPEDFTGQHLQAKRRLDGNSEGLMEKLWSMRHDTVDAEN